MQRHTCICPCLIPHAILYRLRNTVSAAGTIHGRGLINKQTPFTFIVHPIPRTCCIYFEASHAATRPDRRDSNHLIIMHLIPHNHFREVSPAVILPNCCVSVARHCLAEIQCLEPKTPLIDWRPLGKNLRSNAPYDEVWLTKLYMGSTP